MPHVIVKIWPGPSESQKQDLSDQIVKALQACIGSQASSVSVAIEEVSSSRWMKEVYRPDIEPEMSTLYKKPGYEPF